MAVSDHRNTLATVYPGFGKFLVRLDGSRPLTDLRFIGRNFRLDERVPGERADRYRGVAEGSLDDMSDWYDAHWEYMASALWVEQPATGIPRRIDRHDQATCAESFRTGDAMIDLGGTDPSVELIRVERLAPIADAARIAEAELVDRLSEATAKRADAPTRSWVNAALGRWARTRDLRPVWAAFWEDCEDVCDAAGTGWASMLRDRLGLAHIDPDLSGRDVAVVVFRYPVRLIPTVHGVTNHRALAYPTVIDGELSAAFCPAPRNDEWGRVMNLSPDTEEPFREVIHAPVRLSAEHVYRVGFVDMPVSRPLDEVRGLHILWLQQEYGRDDYGLHTDADLFT